MRTVSEMLYTYSHAPIHVIPVGFYVPTVFNLSLTVSSCKYKYIVLICSILYDDIQLFPLNFQH